MVCDIQRLTSTRSANVKEKAEKKQLQKRFSSRLGDNTRNLEGKVSEVNRLKKKKKEKRKQKKSHRYKGRKRAAIIINCGAECPDSRVVYWLGHVSMCFVSFPYFISFFYGSSRPLFYVYARFGKRTLLASVLSMGCIAAFEEAINKRRTLKRR